MIDNTGYMVAALISASKGKKLKEGMVQFALYLNEAIGEAFDEDGEQVADLPTLTCYEALDLLARFAFDKDCELVGESARIDTTMLPPDDNPDWLEVYMSGLQILNEEEEKEA